MLLAPRARNPGKAPSAHSSGLCDAAARRSESETASCSYPGRGETQKGSSREPTRPGTLARSLRIPAGYGEEAVHQPFSGRARGMDCGEEGMLGGASGKTPAEGVGRAGTSPVLARAPPAPRTHRYLRGTRIAAIAAAYLYASRARCCTESRVIKVYQVCAATARGRGGQLIALANTQRHQWHRRPLAPSALRRTGLVILRSIVQLEDPRCAALRSVQTTRAERAYLVVSPLEDGPCKIQEQHEANLTHTPARPRVVGSTWLSIHVGAEHRKSFSNPRRCASRSLFSS